jgi:hypothetical protein
MSAVKDRVAAPQRDQAVGSADKVLRSLPVRIARWTSAVVGFVATTLGVVFVLFPALKPDEPAPAKGAALSNPSPELLTWGQYLDRQDLDRAPYDAKALRRRGIFVEFDYTIEGYKDQALPLRWQLIDARGGDQLGKSRDTLITPEAPKDGGSLAVWVPLPARRVARLYVQLQLYERTGKVSIGRVRTARFGAPGAFTR